MRILKFHKTECGVDFLLNVLSSEEVKGNYINSDPYNTDFFEIIVFKKAAGTLLLNHQKITVSDNTVMFISPFQKRQWKLETDGLDFTVLAFQEDFLNDFFADKVFTYRLLYFYQLVYPLNMPETKENIAKYCELLTEIKAELIAKKIDSVHIIRSLLYYLLQKLNRQYSQKNQLPINKSDNRYAFQYKQLLEVHIKEKQRIEDYTELLNISRISLNKAVKTSFNVTATQLLKQRLLFEIKNYLIHSGLNVSEIANELHFSEPNHLMRFFKTQTGMTTGEFLRDYQNGSY
ncbi:AraC family transcriptional activator of pobA [Chryseobacterium ginsenosidimutans]|uniref:helix-turn-helix domain-containing protein n=1 Tax=Chryseobacterium ginsenosidimutans TaxID=687846 RepID=UPI00278551FB|nr:AraC family transcriptional regulator [Chryseobacterium ginsenosidimutans]MDQ0593621.1 AraC family transcriptional activator of pobA [Chryseobacterium ginsenosidimutans]